MRIHVLPEHPDHSPDAYRTMVTRDGVVVQNCLYADEESGFTDVMAIGDDGKLIIHNRAFVVHRLFGVVHVSR